MCLPIRILTAFEIWRKENDITSQSAVCRRIYVAKCQILRTNIQLQNIWHFPTFILRHLVTFTVLFFSSGVYQINMNANKKTRTLQSKEQNNRWEILWTKWLSWIKYQTYVCPVMTGQKFDTDLWRKILRTRLAVGLCSVWFWRVERIFQKFGFHENFQENPAHTTGGRALLGGRARDGLAPSPHHGADLAQKLCKLGSH